ncbi:hypothetical protein H4R33_006923 [Dimargaris cristalligena]|nr:hypothetical protein H4R33_006923 [Dimargaris cristalligena]
MEPKVFTGSPDADPVIWLRIYKLYCRRQSWDEEVKLEMVPLYLSAMAQAWYVYQEDRFENWEIFEELFLAKFDNKEREIRAWNELQGVRQGQRSIMDLAATLTRLFKQTKTTNDVDKLRYLLNAVNSDHRKQIL